MNEDGVIGFGILIYFIVMIIGIYIRGRRFMISGGIEAVTHQIQDPLLV